MRRMSVTELSDYLRTADPAPLLLDVREPWEYAICHHGIRSRQVALFLDHQGFRNVVNMEGGVAAWAQYVDHNMPTY